MPSPSHRPFSLSEMPRTEPEFAESYQIAYEQASISLQNQATVLESYQARAATIISAAAITAGAST